jgi:two-component system cell cycle sensor histidine kinase/response regulator CckA
MKDKSIAVLLIEDDMEYVHLTQEMLALVWRAPFDLKHADRLSTGIEQLARGTFDVVLLDLSLPDSWGFDTFTRVQAQDPHVPIIVLTGLDDESLVNKVMQEGAREYLVKGEMEGDLLAGAIRYAINSEPTEEIPS